MAKELSGTVKEVLGTAQSVSCTIDGNHPYDVIDKVNSGGVIPPFCTSDHNAVIWHAWFPLDSTDVCSALSFDIKHANYALLSSHLSYINWPQLFMSVSPDNVEGLWQSFKSVIMGSIKKKKTYVLLRHVINNFSSRQYSTCIQRPIKQKRVLWRRRHI